MIGKQIVLRRIKSRHRRGARRSGYARRAGHTYGICQTKRLRVGKNFLKEAVDIGTGYIAAVLLQPLLFHLIIIIGQS